MVEFDVTAEGSVINPRVIASENSCLDRSALNTIQKWKYTPKTDGSGRPVPQRGLRQTFNYQLTE
jgi:TonB family protein